MFLEGCGTFGPYGLAKRIGFLGVTLKVACVSVPRPSCMLPDLPRCEQLKPPVPTTVVLVQHDGLVASETVSQNKPLLR